MLDCDSGFGGVELQGTRLQCCVDAALRKSARMSLGFIAAAA